MNRRNWLSRALGAVLALVTASCSGGGAAPTSTLPGPSAIISFPFVIRVEPATPAPVELGGTLRVIGNNFGNTPGTVSVNSGANAGQRLTIGGADVVKWTNDEIVIKLPTRDASGNPILSTSPVIGPGSVSVARADGTDNPTNADARGTARPVTVQLASVGKLKVTIDKLGRLLVGNSLEYRVVYGSGEQQQIVASFATTFNNDQAATDLEHEFSGLPARTDYQVIAKLYSGPTARVQNLTVATGNIQIESSPMPLQMLAAESVSLAVPLPCQLYYSCNGFDPKATPPPSTAPGGGGVPAPTPGPGGTAGPTATPAPSATPPPGVTPETITSYGTIRTIAGNGANSAISSRAFSCSQTIANPWSTAIDKDKVIHFAMNPNGIGKVKPGTTNCEAIILNENIGAQRPGEILGFAFAANNDLYISDVHPFDRPKYRVAEVKKKVDGSYDLAGATNLDFGSIVIEAPAGITVYKNKVYVASTDDSTNGGGQSYIVEFDIAARTSRIVAGNGTPGYAGNGGAATAAQISPIGVTFGPEGTAYEDLMVIADGGTNSLRAVNMKAAGGPSIDFHGTVIAPGNIDVIAGKNSNRYSDLLTAQLKDFNTYSFGTWELDAGFSGDGGQASEAKLDWPYGPSFDSSGRLYFVDAGNHRIRAIDLNGIMHTLVGIIAVPTQNGQRGFGSPGGKNPTKPYPPGDHTQPNGDDGPANLADVNAPMDMTVDTEPDGSVSLYIADTDAYRLRKVGGLRWQ